MNTGDVSIGQVIDQKRIEELPLFAGNAMDLVQLAPGTVNGTNLRLRKAPFNSAPSQFSTVGGANNQNEFTIDGVMAERSGDLSALLALGSSYQIYDLSSTVAVANGRLQRQPFAGSKKQCSMGPELALRHLTETLGREQRQSIAVKYDSLNDSFLAAVLVKAKVPRSPASRPNSRQPCPDRFFRCLSRSNGLDSAPLATYQPPKPYRLAQGSLAAAPLSRLPLSTQP